MMPSVEWVLTIRSNGSALSNKIDDMPTYGKTLQTLLLQNQENFKAESWYIALGTQELPSLFKLWS